jgi:hypothetical protein
MIAGLGQRLISKGIPSREYADRRLIPKRESAMEKKSPRSDSNEQCSPAIIFSATPNANAFCACCPFSWKPSWLSIWLSIWLWPSSLGQLF